MSSTGNTPTLTSESTSPVRYVHVQEQNSLASDLTTSTAIANSNSTAPSTSYASLSVEEFSSLEAFYSALQNTGNFGLRLSGHVEGVVRGTARTLLSEYAAGYGLIASNRMTFVVRGIQREVEDFQRRNNENTIHVINEPLIEWAIKSTITIL